MDRRLALIPVDARPVTRELPCQIASIGGWEVLVPEKRDLGFLKKPGQINHLIEWLWATAPIVDGFIVSIDMLGYGGLVPSRINNEPEETILARLNILRQLKEKYPKKPIMAFSSTMRISNNNINEEEKEYWQDYGQDIWAYSYHSHKYNKTNNLESLNMVEELTNRIPSSILADYLATRKKNFNVNVSLLQLVQESVLDTLVYPQDDTSEYGLNIREQEQLRHNITELSLFSKVLIYPGADEVAQTLISRMIYLLEGLQPPSFYPFYSSVTGSLARAMYEDRPLVESVKGQVYAMGGYTVESSQEADILLAVNVPGKRQGDLALQKDLEEVDTADRNLGEWIFRLKHYVEKGETVVVADVAFANGADTHMILRLLDFLGIESISGFGAWNTAGNTLGTVISQAVMVHLQKIAPNLSDAEVKHRVEHQIVLRLLDDYLYQSIVRQRVRGMINEHKVTKDKVLHVVYHEFLVEAGSFIRKYQLSYEIEQVYLPWDRTFEIGLDIVKRIDKY